jgi:hypothetical protein
VAIEVKNCCCKDGALNPVETEPRIANSSVTLIRCANLLYQ